MISYNWELNGWMSIILQIWDNFYEIFLQVLTKKKQTLEGGIKIHGPELTNLHPLLQSPSHKK